MNFLQPFYPLHRINDIYQGNIHAFVVQENRTLTEIIVCVVSQVLPIYPTVFSFLTHIYSHMHTLYIIHYIYLNTLYVRLKERTHPFLIVVGGTSRGIYLIFSYFTDGSTATVCDDIGIRANDKWQLSNKFAGYKMATELYEENVRTSAAVCALVGSVVDIVLCCVVLCWMR